MKWVTRKPSLGAGRFSKSIAGVCSLTFCAPRSALAELLDGALGSRKGLESLVGDRLSAFYREPVRSGRHPCLGALYSSELVGEVPGAVRVVLVLVEGF